MPYAAEWEFQLEFRSKDRDKPIVVATTYHPTQEKNHNKIRKLVRNGYKFYKIDKVTITTCNSKKKVNPIFL